MAPYRNLAFRLIDQRRRAVPVLARYDQLASDLSGSGLVGIYDKDANASAASWADARGSGGPTMTAIGTPTYSASLGFSTNGSSNGLFSALSASLDATGVGIWIAAIGKFGGTQSGEVNVSLAGGAGFGARYFTVGGASNFNPPTDIKLVMLPGASQKTSHTTLDSVTQRLAIITDSLAGNCSKVQVVGPLAGQTNSDNRFQSAAGSNAIGVGAVNNGGVFATAKDVKLVLVGVGNLTSAHIETIRQYAATYHGQTYDDTAKAIVAVGDSRTFGQGSTTPATDNWFAQLLADATFSSYFGVNMGVTSRWMQDMRNGSPYTVAPLYSSHRPKNLCILGPAGTNDLASGLRTDAQVIADVQAFATAMKAAGFTVIGCPELPRNLSSLSNNMTEFNYLKAVRDWMVTQVGVSTYFDRVVTYSNAAFTDWTAAQGSTLVSTYPSIWNADGLHLLTAGYAALKADIKADLVAWGGL